MLNKPRVPSENSACSTQPPRKEFTHFQEFVDNLPYFLMTLIGGAILLVGSQFAAWGFAAGTAYVLYGIGGAFWIILFICPYCHFYDTRECPCGYGQISGRVRPKKDERQFKKKFKKHIPVIVPLWIIPVVAAILFLINRFDRIVLYLAIAFAINSFVFLPLLARLYGCGHCTQKDDCPWMTGVKEAESAPGSPTEPI